MTGSSGGEPRRESGIGPRLRSARERNGLTVEQAAQMLHLDPAVLEALEAEDFASLGALVYVKGYVGRYAELVGESAEALQQLLSNAVIPPPDLTRVPRARLGSGRFVGPATIAVVTLLVASSLWWGISRWHEHHLMFPPSARVGPRGVRPGTPAHPAKQSVSVAAPGLRRSVTQRGKPVADGKGRAGRTAAALSAGEVRITLKFSAPSWVEVNDANGRELYHSMAAAAAVHVFQGPAPLYVVLGNAPAVTLAVDGHATRIGALARSDRVASFEVTAHGRVLPTPPASGE